MAIDMQTPESPGWWFARLIDRLTRERPRYEKLDSYYHGEQGIPVRADKACAEAYKRLMRLSVSNTAQLIVRAPLDRMVLLGCRTAAAGDELGDKEGARIMRANSLDADSSLVHRSSLALSMGYAIVGGVDEEIGAPLITAEDPREVIAEVDPARKRKVIAALKVWRDDAAALDRANLYLPGQIHRLARPSDWQQTATTSDPDRVTNLAAGGWDWDGDPEAIPDGRLPVVPFPCSPDARGRTTGVFEAHLGLIDRINYTVLQRLEIATLQAFRQRAIKGEFPKTDENGNEIDYDELFESAPGALWQLPETAEIWESGQVDLGPVRQAIRDDLVDLAGLSGIPLFYLTPDATDGSAEGAALAREQLIFMTYDHIREAGESWKRVMSHAFAFAGDAERAKVADIEMMWAPPERYSLSERGDAAAKALAGGMSRRAVLESVWQKSPSEIDRIEADLAGEALLAQGVAAVSELVSGSRPAAAPDAVPSVNGDGDGAGAGSVSAAG